MFRTEIKIRNAEQKIKFIELRLKKFYNWDAPNEYQKLKDDCISVLLDRMVFLKNHSLISIKRGSDD